VRGLPVLARGKENLLPFLLVSDWLLEWACLLNSKWIVGAVDMAISREASLIVDIDDNCVAILQRFEEAAFLFEYITLQGPQAVVYNA